MSLPDGRPPRPPGAPRLAVSLPDGRPPGPAGAPRLVLGRAVRTADIPVLCRRLVALVRDDPAAAVVVCDVSAVTRPDVLTLGALAWLHLTAHRLGRRLRIRHADPRLAELVALAGLGDVLCLDPPVDG